MTVARHNRDRRSVQPEHGHGRPRPVGTEPAPPAAIEAEEQTIGAVLNLGTIPDGVTLTADDFYRPAHRTIWQAILRRHQAGDPISPPLVIIDLARGGVLDDLGGQAFLMDLWGNAIAPTYADFYAREVAETARQRRILDLCFRLGTIPANSSRPAAEQLADAADLAARIGDLTTAEIAGTDGPVELDAFLTEPDPEYDWLVDGLIERGDRVILTGPEGGGKSTFMRQLAVQLPAGIHPFSPGQTIPPIRVLIVDLENSRTQIRRALRSLRLAAKDHYQPGMLHIAARPDGLDLHDPDDAAWLETQCRTARPDLLMIGPIYKLSDGDPTLEETAKPVAKTLDRLRTLYRFALIIEAHTPHAAAGSKRPTRPYGASLWVRWPEFGIHLDPSGMVTHWRGQRDEREWPGILQRGGEWPWTCRISPREDVWGRIVEFTVRAGKVPTQRDLANGLQVAKGTVQRALADHADEWTGLCEDLKAFAAEAAQ